MAHFTLGPGQIARAVAHRTVEEVWYFVSGHGRMWRRLGERRRLVEVTAGVSVAIPLGRTFSCATTAPSRSPRSPSARPGRARTKHIWSRASGPRASADEARAQRFSARNAMPLPSDSDSWRRSSVTAKALALAIRCRYSCSSAIMLCDEQAFGWQQAGTPASGRRTPPARRNTVAAGIAGQAAAPDVELGGDPTCGPIGHAMAARLDRSAPSGCRRGLRPEVRRSARRSSLLNTWISLRRGGVAASTPRPARSSSTSSS